MGRAALPLEALDQNPSSPLPGSVGCDIPQLPCGILSNFIHSKSLIAHLPSARVCANAAVNKTEVVSAPKAKWKNLICKGK